MGQHQMDGFFRLSNLLLTIIGAVSLLTVLAIKESHAEFALNFQSDPGRLSGSINPDTAGFRETFTQLLSCNRGGVNSGCTQGTVSTLPGSGSLQVERTPFLQEIVFDGVNGYFHVIVGDPTQNFAQETFIRLGTRFWPNSQPNSSSAGTAGTANGGWASPGGSPLDTSVVSGSGTANPERVQVRQIVRDPEMTQEFLKTGFLTKPRITQTVTSGDMTSFFDLNMTAIAYRGAGATTSVAPLINTVTLGSAPAGNFDMAQNKQNSTVTAGQYSWAVGGGDGQSAGTYTYVGGGSFNLNAIDWKAFYNPGDNTCWAFKQNPGGACTP